MTTSQLILKRYTDLLGGGELEAAFSYLAEDVIYNTWLGVVEGKDNVVTFLRDNIRFLHHNRNFNHWRQVQHCLDSDLRPFRDDCASPGAFFNLEGYDSQGYATFERDGTIGDQPKFAAYSIRVKETVVIFNSQVALVSITKQL